MTFNGFISYSHAADGRLAPAVQRGLHRLAKPWHRRRALWIFRDQTGLAVTPGLWSSIQTALDGSEWFVLLASPEAARSPWVNREIEHWVATKSADRILPVLTDGVWQWDPVARDFTEGSTAAPAALRGVFAEEPLFLDLRWARDDLQLSLRHSRFRDAIAQLAAPMHGVSKDDLEGEDVRQHRRMRRLRSVAVSTLVVLALVASLAGVLAVRYAGRANTASVEAGHQQRVAAEHRGQAATFAEQARVQEANARTQQKRAADAAAEASRQEENARTQGENARQQGEYARQQADNARRQQESADRAAARAREQERLAGEQRAAAQRSAGDARRQRQLAQEQERLAQQAAQEARRQKQLAQEQQRRAEEAGAQARRQERIAQEQQRRAEQAGAEARRQEQVAQDQQRRAEQAGAEARRQEQRAEAAAEEARTEKANADQQQRIAIGRRVNNEAKAIVKEDPRTALMLGVAAAKVQADDEARRQLAGLVTSTRYAGSLEKVKDLAYSTAEVLITQDSAFALRLWKLADRANPTPLGELGVYYSWTISPDGRTVAAEANDRPVVVLIEVANPADPEVVGELPVGPDSSIGNLTFSQDGRTLLIGAFDEDTDDVGDLWDVANPRRPQPLATRFDGSRAVTDAAFSPNGNTLVTRQEDNSTAVWDLSTRTGAKRIGTLDEPLGGRGLNTMAFLRTAPILVTGGDDAPRLIDLSTPTRPKETLKMRNEGGVITSVIVSPDGRRLVIGCYEGLVTVYDVVGTDRIVPTQADSVRDPGLLRATALSPDGRTLTTANFHSTATHWNVGAYGAAQVRADLAGDLLPPGEQGLAAAFTPDGRAMLTVGSSPQAAVWEVTGQGAPVRRATPTVHDKPIHLAAVTPDGRTLATTDLEGRVRVSDTTDPAHPVTVAEFTEEAGWNGEGDELAISPNGRVLALTNKYGTPVLWEVTRGRAATRLGPLADSRLPVAFSPDGRTLAARDGKGSTASLWTLAGPAPTRLGELGGLLNSTLTALAFSSDGHTVAVGGHAAAGLWDVSQARPRQSGKLVNGGPVSAMVFGQDGRTLAAVDGSKVTVWEFAERADPIQVATITGITKWVSSRRTAMFSPDGRTLTISGTYLNGALGTARLWNLTTLAELRADPSVQACAMSGRGLTEDEWARYLPELRYQPTCPR